MYGMHDKKIGLEECSTLFFINSKNDNNNMDTIFDIYFKSIFSIVD